MKEMALWAGWAFFWTCFGWLANDLFRTIERESFRDYRRRSTDRKDN